MTLSYNQIIKVSRAFKEAHHVLKHGSFGNGWEADMVLHNQQATFKTPLTWMVDRDTPLQEGIESFAFRVMFLAPVVTMPLDRGSDLMSTNVNEVKSDMMRCANDFVTYWIQQTDNYDTLGFDKSVNRGTVEDYTDDKLAGCYIDVRFYQPLQYDECGIPIGTPTSVSTCAPVYIYEDGVLVDTVASGGSYSYASGGGSFTYDLYFDGVDTTQDVTVDGTNITINLE